MNRYIYI